eukprot:10664545-Alexandrium_andersonii.AAC.1
MCIRDRGGESHEPGAERHSRVEGAPQTPVGKAHARRARHTSRSRERSARRNKTSRTRSRKQSKTIADTQ